MEQLLELFLGGGLRLSLFDPQLLALDQDFPKSDLLALLMLQRRGELAMSDLAADMGAPLSTATGIGNRLHRRGLVERRRSAQDRRVVLLQLTPAGEELAGRVRAHIDDLLRRIQAVLTPAEVEQITTLVFKVFTALMSKPGETGQRVGADKAEVRRITLDEED